MSKQTPVVPDPSYRWVILGTVYICLLAFSFVFQGIPPILSLIIVDLDLSHAEAGLLMSLFALPGVFLAIPIGLLGDRFGPKNLVVVGLVALIAGSLLIATGRSFQILALGRSFAGVGGVSIAVLGAQLISRWFVGRELGLAVGIYTTSMPLGTVASLNTLGAVGKAIGWQGAVLASGAMAVVALLLFITLLRPPPITQADHGASAQKPNLSTLLRVGLPIWLVGFIWMLFNAAVISFLTFAPDYFVAKGYGIEFAGFLASFLMILSPPLAPLVGYLLDRVGHEEAFIVAGGLLVFFSILFVPSANSALFFLLIPLSVGSALVPTPVFALPPKILRTQHLGTGYGIVSTCLNFGMVIGPFLSGLARDVTGSYQVSFYLMSFFGLLAAAVGGTLYLWRRKAVNRSCHG